MVLNDKSAETLALSGFAETLALLVHLLFNAYFAFIVSGSRLIAALLS